MAAHDLVEISSDEGTINYPVDMGGSGGSAPIPSGSGGSAPVPKGGSAPAQQLEADPNAEVPSTAEVAATKRPAAEAVGDDGARIHKRPAVADPIVGPEHPEQPAC